MKIIIIGAGGRLGAVLMRAYGQIHEIRGFTHAQIDIGDLDEIADVLPRFDFDLMINCAAMTNVDLCEEQPDKAFRINADAPDLFARICDEKRARLIHFSTDYVFDGKKRTPYSEEDEAEPLSVYGESKREGEEYVLGPHDRHLVVRVSWVFGPDRPSFIDNVIQRAREQEHVEAVTDKFSTPTYARDIAEMLPQFFEVPVGGLLHFSNSGECSWQEYAQHALNCCHEAGVRLQTITVAPINLSDMTSFIARRPPYTVLSTARYASLTGKVPRPWQDAVREYVREFYSAAPPAAPSPD